jgi:hypothetical protein
MVICLKFVDMKICFLYETTRPCENPRIQRLPIGAPWCKSRFQPKTGALQAVPRHREIDEYLAKKIFRDLS